MLRILLHLPRWSKKLIFTVHDLLLIFAAFWLSIGLRLDIVPELQVHDNWILLLIVSIFSVSAFAKLGLYRAVIRYVSEQVVLTILFGSVISLAAMLGASFYLHLALPRSVPIMYFLLVMVFLIGSRFTLRGLLQVGSDGINHPVIIYGAGESGRQLLASIKRSNKFDVVAFVDDNKRLHRTIIEGRQVYAPTALADLVARYGIKDILLAIPSASTQQRKDIIARLESFECQVLTIPGLLDLVGGNISVNTLKKVSVVELLGRDAVKPDQELMQENICNKVVMVTGAGGSIGSELCRQIVQTSPSALILFELSEFSLYQIKHELRAFIKENELSIDLIPALGSVQDLGRLEALMNVYNVQTVYHAAAYKHVPLVEYNTIEGVRNNVFGTLRCAQAAINTDVETFVLISTDKAVRPTNTMGSTKRMAELALQALAERSDHKTRFCMVRFGNVLGSSGSVIPLFEKQIAAGGPVTLTHKEITRFFMTIPEAAQLVIQAGAMGKGGDVFLLDMGEPIKIVDLAEKMIRLSGLSIRNDQNPEGDIEIAVTGLRPGEKLYEELLVGDNAEGTDHARIMTSKEIMMPWNELEPLLSQLSDACSSFDAVRVRELLLAAPTAFSPSDDVCDILLAR